jgi:streptogramin lyase
MIRIKVLQGIVLGLALLGGEVRAMQLTGRVTDGNQRPLPYVRVRVSGAGLAPFSRSVFTAEDGTFAVDYGKSDNSKLTIDVFRIGWRESHRKLGTAAGGRSLMVSMRQEANVADQVPPSAWLRGDPDSQAYQMTTLQCSNCHQLGATRVRNFSHSLKDLPVGERSTAWVTQAADDLANSRAAMANAPQSTGDPASGGGSQTAETSRADATAAAHTRISGWDGIVQYMRLVTMYLGSPPKLRWNLKEGSPYFQALLQPATSLFIPQDMALIVPNLAHNYPVSFDTLTDYDDLQRLGSYGVTAKTVVDEFVLPTFGWTREVAITPGSSKVWFVETDKDRLGGLDPATGVVSWYPIPAKGQQGPHTMNADANGNIWMGLEDSFNIARFDTSNQAWRLYPPPPGTNFGVTHDFAYNTDRHVEPDAKGRIFITDMGKNELWGINIASGDIKTYRMPLPPGESHFHALLYGAAIDPGHHRVWWAQLFGNVGSLDTERDIAERVIPFRKGAGPRRLAVQEDGTLWIPLFGAGQIVKVDGETGVEVARYSIPDRGAAPYGITYDRKRQAIWAATSNSDRIYRFDISTQSWRQYPLPRRESYIRMVELDPQTNDVWTSYAALPVGKRDAKVFGTESANNMIVRLHPGD